MNRRQRIILFATVVFVAAYAVWCRSGRTLPATPPDLRLKSFVEYGTDSGRGNVLCIQPYMLTSDYVSWETLRLKIDAYLGEANKRGWVNRKTIVVFPEYIGAWLVVAGEKRGVYEAPTVDRAMKLMAASNPISFAKAFASARGRDKIKDALFRMKAAEMARFYDEVFSVLAREYRVTIVAGSIILPSPKVMDGRLASGSGPLYNVSVVYRADGRAYHQLVVKSFPTKEEQPFLAKGAIGDTPVFDTPAGRLGVLVCADAWFPKAYDVLKRKKASVVAVPSYGFGDDRVLKRVWPGYSGFPNPTDVAPGDPGRITEWQAFMKYALPGRLPKSGIPDGVQVPLRGRLWDLGSHGTTIVVRKGEVTVAPMVDGAQIVNVWL